MLAATEHQTASNIFNQQIRMKESGSGLMLASGFVYHTGSNGN